MKGSAMKVKPGAGIAKAWPNGVIESFTGAAIEVDNGDAERVAYFRELVRVGLAEMIEDAPPDETPEPEKPVAAAPRKTAVAGKGSAAHE